MSVIPPDIWATMDPELLDLQNSQTSSFPAKEPKKNILRTFMQEALSDEMKQWIISTRRQLHCIPELAFEEKKTSLLIRNILTSLEVSFQYPYATEGIVAWLGSGASPCVGLRADMDGLPVAELTGLPFASTIPGHMHACGHDCHMAVQLGAIRLLSKHVHSLPGTVKFVFQPGEEGGAGAQHMVHDGALGSGPETLPAVEAIFGLHVWPWLETGLVGSRPGPIMAASGRFHVTIKGRGGHAAIPHLAIDPIPAAAAAVLALQNLVARETSPTDSAVLSITTLKAGEASNVIPETACFGGTIRALSKETHAHIYKRAKEIVVSTAAAYGCEAQFEVTGTRYPPTRNDPFMWEIARDAIIHTLGDRRPVEIPEPSMAAEDFAFYLEHVPGCFLWLGCRPPSDSDSAPHPLHSPYFTIDEDALAIGAAIQASIAYNFLFTRSKPHSVLDAEALLE